jgi:hypothetical protein
MKQAITQDPKPSQAVSDELYSLFLKAFQHLQDPIVLAESPLLLRPLIQQHCQQAHYPTASQALKAVFTEILALLTNENEAYADLLRGRFWERKQVEEMLAEERPMAMSRRTFANHQRNAIQTFIFLFLQTESSRSQTPTPCLAPAPPVIITSDPQPLIEKPLPTAPRRTARFTPWRRPALIKVAVGLILFVNCITSLFLLWTPLQVGSETPPPTTQPAAYTYTAMDGAVVELYPYVGAHIALLVPIAYYEPVVLSRITEAIDRAYRYYWQATGREPLYGLTFQGRTTVAVVPSACGGSGCGNVGATGIELQTQAFEELFYAVKERNQFEQLVFFELGYNFWFYEEKIAYPTGDSVATGYAVFMRFMAMEAAGVAGAPFGGVAFADFEREVKSALVSYLADPALTWENTLQVGQSPVGSSADLFAAFLFALRERYGDEFVMRLWKEVDKLPERQTTQEAIDNFVAAASRATQTDLTTLFADTWRWPVSPIVRVHGATAP